MREGLLRERVLTLQCAIEICRTAEESESQLKEMGKEKSIHVLRNKKKYEKPKHTDHKPTVDIQCTYFGKKKTLEERQPLSCFW